jgi:hypothetical protein
MLNNKIKYGLMTLSVVAALSGCNQRTITLQPGASGARHTTVQRTTHVVKRPTINEEILIKKNPNLGNAVNVPKNNPSLGRPSGGHDVPDSPYENESVSVSDPTVQNQGGLMERISFPVEEYKHIKKRGSSTVSGHVYLENGYTSEKIIGKKVKLYLNPVTTYSRQWYEESFLGGYKLSKSDPRLFNYLKFTMSDGDGKFSFYGVPRGQYYLVGTMNCAAECGFNGKESVRLVKEVSVGRGTTRVDLMKNVP